MSNRITLDPGIDPWERQPGEPGRRYGQFLIYRDMGLTRTLTKAADALTLAYGSIRITSSQFHWQDPSQRLGRPPAAPVHRRAGRGTPQSRPR